MADPLRSSAFAGRIGEKFRARTADGTEIELELTRCNESPYGDPAQWRDDIGRVPFSIEFNTASEHAWGQGLFTLTGDPELGELDIFMTPVGRNPDGSVRYEAVFS